MSPAPSAQAVASAFRLADPTGPLVPVRYVSSETWRLDTRRGRYFVKRLVVDGWWDQLDRAMAFERRACAAGIRMPEAIEPADPAWGLAADLGDGQGVVRVHTWLDGAAADPGADLSDWYGATLAALHGLEPAGERRTDSMWPLWYGVEPPQRWADWLAAGLRQGLLWAPVLRQRLALVLDLTEQIEAAYRVVDDHVVTHRDVLPHNVLVPADGGPVLIDWDTAGPDSATLETAAALHDYARYGTGTEPDLARFTAALAAYRAHGGVVQPCPFPLARRMGVHLARCAERIRVTLGVEPAGSIDAPAAEVHVAQRLAALPAFSASLPRWSHHLTA
ncbi:phosphotransferase enzyme family protein [Micromonospora sp. NPDC003197]